MLWVNTASAMSASLKKKIARLVGRLGSGPRLVGRMGSGVRVSSFFKKSQHSGSVRVRTRLAADRADVVCRLADRTDLVFTQRVQTSTVAKISWGIVFHGE